MADAQKDARALQTADPKDKDKDKDEEPETDDDDEDGVELGDADPDLPDDDGLTDDELAKIEADARADRIIGDAKAGATGPSEAADADEQADRRTRAQKEAEEQAARQVARQRRLALEQVQGSIWFLLEPSDIRRRKTGIAWKSSMAMTLVEIHVGVLKDAFKRFSFAEIVGDWAQEFDQVVHHPRKRKPKGLDQDEWEARKSAWEKLAELYDKRGNGFLPGTLAAEGLAQEEELASEEPSGDSSASEEPRDEPEKDEVRPLPRRVIPDELKDGDPSPPDDESVAELAALIADLRAWHDFDWHHLVKARIARARVLFERCLAGSWDSHPVLSGSHTKQGIALDAIKLLALNGWKQ